MLFRSVGEWRALGVKTTGGDALPESPANAGILLPAGAKGPAFLLLPNFAVLLKYNNAVSYALAVATLADRMAGAPPLRQAWPRHERPLARSERIQFQTDLARLGFNPGAADGVLGRQSRAALRQYQKAKGLPADGFPTAALLAILDKTAQEAAP